MPTVHFNFYLLTTFLGWYRIISFKFLLLLCEITKKNLAECSENSGLFNDIGLLNADYVWMLESEPINGVYCTSPITFSEHVSSCRLFLKESLKRTVAEKNFLLSNILCKLSTCELFCMKSAELHNRKKYISEDWELCVL